MNLPNKLTIFRIILVPIMVIIPFLGIPGDILNIPIQNLIIIAILVLVISVEPGFGGQKFMDIALDKIKYLKEQKTKKGYHYLIEVDGGINEETSKLVKDAGVDVLVAGSYLFKSDNMAQRIRILKK